MARSSPLVSRMTRLAIADHQQHADDGHEQVPRLEAVQRQRHQQGQPEDDVQHHGRTQALGGQGHRRVSAAHARTHQQAVPERVTHGVAAREAVAQGQGRQLDPRQRGKARVRALGDERHGSARNRQTSDKTSSRTPSTGRKGLTDASTWSALWVPPI